MMNNHDPPPRKPEETDLDLFNNLSLLCYISQKDL